MKNTTQKPHSRNTAHFLICLLLIFPAVHILSAQEAIQENTTVDEAVSDYRLDESGRILQRISWTRANAYFYEVEIERQNGEGEWEPEIKERTGELFIETALTPGMYRYRILNYNVLERVAAVSDWVGIRVFAAREPKIDRISPAAYYIDNAEKEFTLLLEGADLFEEAEVYIIAMTEGAQRVKPLSVQYSTDEQSIILTFAVAGLALGAYDIAVTNPGGLQTIFAGFQVTFRSPLDINVSLGYTPMLPFYGYIFDVYKNLIYPVGFYGRVSVVPLKRLWGFLGVEFTPQINLMETGTDNYTVNGTMISFTLDALYQLWFPNRVMAVNFRLGAGLGAITGIKFEHKDGSVSEEVATVLPLVNAGISFEWLAWRDLFVEASLEYVQMFSSRSPTPGYFQARLGGGWRF